MLAVASSKNIGAELRRGAQYQKGISQIERQIQAAGNQGETYAIVSDLRVYAPVGWVR